MLNQDDLPLSTSTCCYRWIIEDRRNTSYWQKIWNFGENNKVVITDIVDVMGMETIRSLWVSAKPALLHWEKYSRTKKDSFPLFMTIFTVLMCSPALQLCLSNLSSSSAPDYTLHGPFGWLPSSQQVPTSL